LFIIKILLKEVLELALADKADACAVLFVMNIKPKLLCQLANLDFGEVSQWEDRSGKLQLIKAV
jgi:hypothetical protein